MPDLLGRHSGRFWWAHVSWHLGVQASEGKPRFCPAPKWGIWGCLSHLPVPLSPNLGGDFLPPPGNWNSRCFASSSHQVAAGNAIFSLIPSLCSQGSCGLDLQRDRGYLVALDLQGADKRGATSHPGHRTPFQLRGMRSLWPWLFSQPPPPRPPICRGSSRGRSPDWGCVSGAWATATLQSGPLLPRREPEGPVLEPKDTGGEREGAEGGGGARTVGEDSSAPGCSLTRNSAPGWQTTIWHCPCVG